MPKNHLLHVGVNLFLMQDGGFFHKEQLNGRIHNENGMKHGHDPKNGRKKNHYA